MSRQTVKIRTPAPGYVYVLSNPEMPGIVKIGRTALTPKQRAQQLRTTGVPGRFSVVYSAWSSDAAGSEARAHRLLAGNRVSKDREFFRVSRRRAKAVVARVCGRRRVPFIVWAAIAAAMAYVAWTYASGLPGFSSIVHTIIHAFH